MGQLLDLNAGRIDREFADQPAAQAELLHTWPTSMSSAAKPPKAGPAERALALYAAERWPSAAARDAQVQGLVDQAGAAGSAEESDAERRTLAQAEVLPPGTLSATHRWAAQLLAAQAWLPRTRANWTRRVAWASERAGELRDAQPAVLAHGRVARHHLHRPGAI